MINLDMMIDRGTADQATDHGRSRGRDRGKVSFGILDTSGSSPSTRTTPVTPQLHFRWDAEHDLTIRKIFDHRMGRRLQQILDDVRQGRNHRTTWLRPEIKKALFVHWETDERFRHRCLTHRANRASARSFKYTGGSATFMKTRPGCLRTSTLRPLLDSAVSRAIKPEKGVNLRYVRCHPELVVCKHHRRQQGFCKQRLRFKSGYLVEDPPLKWKRKLEQLKDDVLTSTDCRETSETPIFQAFASQPQSPKPRPPSFMVCKIPDLCSTLGLCVGGRVVQLPSVLLSLVLKLSISSIARYENTLVVKLDIAAQEEFKLIEHGLEHIWERKKDNFTCC
ncbi:hypothetical protein AHAS_Ahas18G0148800 [Arachis hypogaea]